MRQRCDELLDATVALIQGQTRSGQTTMSQLVAKTLEKKSCLIVQAGTGTGKSLAYLVPATLWAIDNNATVVVSTATLALQKQLFDIDIPQVAHVIEQQEGKTLTSAVLKGWRHYVCLHKIRSKTAAPSLFDTADIPNSEGSGTDSANILGKEVQRIRDWAETSDTGERDELVPQVSNKAWSHASIESKECLADSCPFVDECFARQARKEAAHAHIVVTNHALLGIETMMPIRVLPSCDAIIIDEAHELVHSIRSQGTFELSQAYAASLAAGLEKHVQVDTSLLKRLIVAYGRIIEAYPEQVFPELPDDIRQAVKALADCLRTIVCDIAVPDNGDETQMAVTRQARSAVEELMTRCEDIAMASADTHGMWLRIDQSMNRYVTIAPLQVGTYMATNLFDDKPVVLTSATLRVGGSFDHIARECGVHSYESEDVGTPFAYDKQAILYCPSHIPAPAQSGISSEALDECERLIQASDGGALCLFSSYQACEQAAEMLRESHPERKFFVQRQDQLHTLIERFHSDPNSCLMGTMSLWQGIDIPGLGCRLVIIDRLPFPHLHDPLIKALSNNAHVSGGNGFMDVMLPHAALKLAQGAGRLIRRKDDRGVVAVLDSRLVHRRYGSFFMRTLPPMWPTRDPKTVCAALERLAIEVKENM
ncbi:MAG: ATP-dependent DNA helicase [Actinomycetaceae bacterium]|nr:ATP-dependent DNA helicase [Actinomycetaceae bacterium]